MSELKTKRYLCAKQVRHRYGGASHMWLLRRIADSEFPTPIFFGRCRFWLESDLDAWDAAQKEKPAPIRPDNLRRGVAA